MMDVNMSVPAKMEVPECTSVHQSKYRWFDGNMLLHEQNMDKTNCYHLCYYYHWVGASAEGLIVPEGITCCGHKPTTKIT